MPNGDLRTSNEQVKPFAQWSRRELIDRVRGLDAAKDESTFAIELLIAAGFVSREKADEARAIVRSWGPAHEPPAVREWPLLARIKADIIAHTHEDPEDGWLVDDEQHRATLDLLYEAMQALQRAAQPPSTEPRDELLLAELKNTVERVAFPADGSVCYGLMKRAIAALEEAAQSPLERLQRPFTPEEAKAYCAFIEEHFQPAPSQSSEAGRVERLVSAFKQVRADLALQSGTWSNAASYGLMPEDIGLERVDEDSPTPTKRASDA